MKKLIITGGNGQLGRAINELYKDREDIVCINTDVDELDITDLAAVQAFVAKEKPYAIVNCADASTITGTPSRFRQGMASSQEGIPRSYSGAGNRTTPAVCREIAAFSPSNVGGASTIPAPVRRISFQ